MFEEVGIDLVGDAVIGFRHRPHGLGWAGFPGRAAWGRILPEAAVLEDLADDVVLMGLTTPNGRTRKRKQFGYGNSSSSKCKPQQTPMQLAVKRNMLCDPER